jgi:hypothetical protein
MSFVFVRWRFLFTVVRNSLFMPALYGSSVDICMDLRGCLGVVRRRPSYTPCKVSEWRELGSLKSVFEEIDELCEGMKTIKDDEKKKDLEDTH